MHDGDGSLEGGREELNGLLSRERRRLQTLLFKLESARHLVLAGELRFLPWTATEIEAAVARARESELVRALLVHRLARDLDVADDDLTLRAMAAASDEPYATLFSGHRDALLDLVANIERAGAAARRLASRGLPDLERVNPSLPSLIDFLR